jgi:hypothetical protein
MTRNVGSGDRIMRAVGGASLLTCSLLAPLPLAIRVGIFGSMGVYLLMTTLVGTCVGYALMGKSTCPGRAPR